jgi:hypothetical protein
MTAKRLICINEELPLVKFHAESMLHTISICNREPLGISDSGARC